MGLGPLKLSLGIYFAPYWHGMILNLEVYGISDSYKFIDLSCK